MRNYRIIGFLCVLLFAVFIAGCTPVRVATRGAQWYHNEDCKYVQNSLKKYGNKKRIHYNSNLSVRLSGKKPCPHCSVKVD